MRKTLAISSFLFCLSLLARLAVATPITLSLSGPASVVQGSDLALQVDIANAPVNPGLAAYTVTISYNPALIPNDQMEGSFLSDVGNSFVYSGVPEGTNFSVTVGDGVVLPLGEIQITDITNFGDPTPDSTGTLFTLDFNTPAAGSYDFGFVTNNATNGFFNEALIDGNANQLPDSDSLYNALTVDVTPTSSTAPEPISWPLAAAGLAAIALVKRTRLAR